MSTEQQAGPRIFGAVYADEGEVPLDPVAVRRSLERARAGFELTEAEREQVLRAMQNLVPAFEQIRRAFADMLQGLGPMLAQLGESMRKVSQSTQGDFALAPPRPDGKGRRRGPGRRGRAAQQSTYGPQGRRQGPR